MEAGRQNEDTGVVQKELVIEIVLCEVAVFGGAGLVKNRKPFNLKFAFKLHNPFLTLDSKGLLGLFLK